jgi:hypothetical protein
MIINSYKVQRRGEIHKLIQKHRTSKLENTIDQQDNYHLIGKNRVIMFFFYILSLNYLFDLIA